MGDSAASAAAGTAEEQVAALRSLWNEGTNGLIPTLDAWPIATEE